MRKARELPDWSLTELAVLGRAYTARVDRTLELLEQIAAGLPKVDGPAVRRRKPPGTIKLKERRR